MIITLCLVALAVAAVYVGTVGAAFAALMRLSLRLLAERGARAGNLGRYLDDPVQLFLPVRGILGAIHILATLCFVQLIGLDSPPHVLVVLGLTVAFILVWEHVVPLLLVRRDPERALAVVLPSFDAIARAAWPVLSPIAGLLYGGRRGGAEGAEAGREPGDQGEATDAYLDAGEHQGLIERDERRLLQSIVDFSDTLVREVMTPRPDIVAIRAEATLDDLRAFFREQEYSRILVYAESLDNVLGFVFVKDLIRLPADAPGTGPIGTLVRPAHAVPETKKVSDLLREFQRQQVQIALVVDEYGGTAGLVTIEDLLEEIVGEIRDEYDVESEAITEEADGAFLVSGKADIESVCDRLGVAIEREGFETFGGYILARAGRVPAVGEAFEFDGLQVEVIDAERRRVHKVRVRRRAEAIEAPVAADDAGGDPA